MSDPIATLRAAAARYVEAKRKLEAKDHTGAELEALIGGYREAVGKLLAAAQPVGAVELEREAQAKDQAA